MAEQGEWGGNKKEEKGRARTTLFHNVWGRVTYLRKTDEFRLTSEVEVLAFVICEELELIVNKKIELRNVDACDKERSAESVGDDISDS